MKKIIEKFFYSFGFSCANTHSPQLDFLRSNVPASFKHKALIDLGCGDGRMTQVLAEIFQAKKVLAVDYMPALVKSAQSKGLTAKVVDLETTVISGELGVMWGVLHHLPKREMVLKKLAKNFDYLFIREEIKRLKLFEIGELMTEKQLVSSYEQAFGKANISLIKDKKNQVLLLFYKKPKK